MVAQTLLNVTLYVLCPFFFIRGTQHYVANVVIGRLAVMSSSLCAQFRGKYKLCDLHSPNHAPYSEKKNEFGSMATRGRLGVYQLCRSTHCLRNMDTYLPDYTVS